MNEHGARDARHHRNGTKGGSHTPPPDFVVQPDPRRNASRTKGAAIPARPPASPVVPPEEPTAPPDTQSTPEGGVQP